MPRTLMFGRRRIIRTARYVVATALGALVVACSPTTIPSSLTVSVANESASAATFAWSSPGLFGLPFFPDTGNEPIAGCGVYRRSFNPGHQEIAVSTGTGQLRLSFDVASDDDQTAYVVIGSDGTAQAVDGSTFPEHPCSS